MKEESRSLYHVTDTTLCSVNFDQVHTGAHLGEGLSEGKHLSLNPEIVCLSSRKCSHTLLVTIARAQLPSSTWVQLFTVLQWLRIPPVLSPRAFHSFFTNLESLFLCLLNLAEHICHVGREDTLLFYSNECEGQELRRQRQAGLCECWANLVYTPSFRPSRVAWWDTHSTTHPQCHTSNKKTQRIIELWARELDGYWRRVLAALQDILRFVLAFLSGNSQLPVTPADLMPSLASVGACEYVTEKLT